jgi:hypothetical protein
VRPRVNVTQAGRQPVPRQGQQGRQQSQGRAVPVRSPEPPRSAPPRPRHPGEFGR